MFSVDRSESDVLSGKGIKVTLGGQEYTLSPKKGRAHSRKFRKVISPFLTGLEGLGGLAQKHFNPQTTQLSERDFDGLARLFSSVAGEGLDAILDLVYEWEPSLEEDRTRLEEEATDEEFFKAFMVIVGFVYGPFVSLLGVRMEKKEIGNTG